MIIDHLQKLGIWSDTEFSEIKSHLTENPSEIPENILGKIKTGIDRIGTRDYFLNQPDYQQQLQQERTKLAGEVHGKYKDFLHHTLKSEYSDIFSEDDLQRLIHPKDVKSKEAIAAALKTMKDGYLMQMQKLKEQSASGTLTPEAEKQFQDSLAEKDQAIKKLKSDLEAAKSEKETSLQQIKRQYEEQDIKSNLSDLIRGQNLANPKQLQAALTIVSGELFGNYYPKISGNKIQAFQKENPTIPANDPDSKTALDVEKWVVNILDKHSFLAANRQPGGQNPIRTTRQEPEKPFQLPANVDPDSEYAKRLQRYAADRVRTPESQS